MSPLDWFKKEKPMLSMQSMGGGAAGLMISGEQTSGPGPTNVSGGTAYSFGGKFIHVFTSPGTFTIGAPNNATFEFVVIGGGGGGGVYRGGGGGSGGWVSSSAGSGPAGLPVVIGAGGNGGTQYSPTADGATTGADSTFTIDSTTYTAKGGGRGGDGYEAGDPGGSGGGSNWGPPPGVAQPSNQPGAGNPGPSTNYGGAGGAKSPGSPKYGSGGGGGVGGDAAAGTSTGGGAGGIGRQLPTSFQAPDNPIGTPGPAGDFYVGGGGGGGSIFTPVGPGQVSPNGGAGGGGSGGPEAGGAGVNGVANTGGGGGGDVSGADGSPTHHPGGDGGSGLVVIAYPTASSFPA